MICSKCGEGKPIERFARAQGTKTGYKKSCKDCTNEYMRNYYRRKPEKYESLKGYVKVNDGEYKRAHRRHGLTDEQFNAMVDRSGGLCYSCGEEPATAIDHDHECCSGSYSCGDCVRGLLCNGCNSALGHVRDSSERLEKLVIYLKN